MREVITLQVGQCGNQIGNAFWNLLLLEHELTSDEDTALSSFFYREQKGRNNVLRARALLVDMECGPLQETMRSPLGNLFNDTQYIMDVSGAGNNFAHGYFFYGPQYQDKLCEGLRRNVERCESLQAFSLIHSLGGGTGSGVGSYLLSLLADEFNKVTRFSTCVYPSEENDVITSPYNTILSTRELVLSADCVFPLKNSALFSFHQSENPAASTSATSAPTTDPSRCQKDRGFDLVNLIAARMLCNVTSSSRFHGELNVDLNEIYTNLVPFPKLHFLCGALNIRYPTTAQQRLRSDYSRTALQRAFADVTGPRGQLTGIQGLVLQTSPPIMIASAFLGRGKIILSDFLRCVSRAQSSFRFPVWNSDACKIGLCGSATPGEEMSVMALYNSSSFAVPLSKELQNFQALFRAKAMLHHYTKFTEEETIRQAEYEVFELYEAYRSLQQNVDPSNGSHHSGYSRFSDTGFHRSFDSVSTSTE